MKRLPKALSTDHKTYIPTGKLQKIFLSKLAHMETQIGKKFSKAQQRYKRYFNKKVLVTPNFRVGESWFLERPPENALSQSKRLAGEEKSKFLPKVTGSFKVLADNRDTVTIYYKGITNTIYIDRATAVPGCENERRGQGNVEDDAQVTEEQQISYANSEKADKKSKEPATEATETQTEYVVDHIIGHKKVRNKIHYRVRWYGYTAEDVTIEPAKNTPQKFITSYWKRQKKKATL